MRITICENCKKDFKYHGRRQRKYCSMSCRDEHKETKPIISNCISCGIEFKQKFVSKDIKKFCTRECYFKSQQFKNEGGFKSVKYKKWLSNRMANRRSKKSISLAYYYRNREKYKEYYENVSKYSIRRMFQNLKQREPDIKIDFIILDNWHISQIKECCYCGINQEHWTLMHPNNKTKRLTIDRKDNNVGYEISNMVLACDTCNKIKNDILSFEEMKEIGDKYIKPKWQSKLLTMTVPLKEGV